MNLDKLKRSKFFNRFIFIFFSAFILMFFSEYFFLNTDPTFNFITSLTKRPISAAMSILELWMFYTFFAYILFIAIEKFNVSDLWSLFLAGSLFGWWVEGMVIPVLYEALPFSISWTSLGWHPIVDVILGWYIVRRVLHKDFIPYTALLSVSLGGFWGVWATWFWVEDTEPILPLNFFLLSFFLGILLIISYIVIDKIKIDTFKISKTEIIIFSILSLLGLVLQIYIVGYIALIVLPSLILITGSVLWINKKKEFRENVIQILNEGTVFKNYFTLILMPLTASLVYWFVYTFEINLGVGDIIPPILMIAGFLLFIASIIKVIFKKRSQRQGILR